MPMSDLYCMTPDKEVWRNAHADGGTKHASLTCQPVLVVIHNTGVAKPEHSQHDVNGECTPDCPLWVDEPMPGAPVDVSRYTPKDGDVAAIWWQEEPGHRKSRVAVFDKGFWAMGRGKGFTLEDLNRESLDAAVYPLLAVDPADPVVFIDDWLRETIESIIRTSLDDEMWNQLQARIIEHLKRVKKAEEPSGFGALVEGVNGVLYTHTDRGRRSRSWVSDGDSVMRTWDEIEPKTVHHFGHHGGDS